jgi:hypothetical protein
MIAIGCSIRACFFIAAFDAILLIAIAGVTEHLLPLLASVHNQVCCDHINEQSNRFAASKRLSLQINSAEGQIQIMEEHRLRCCGGAMQDGPDQRPQQTCLFQHTTG